MKILLVEDNPVRQQYFKRSLKGCTVTFARTAKEAQHALDEDLFEVVLLDHDLENPQETGYDVALHLRETANRHALVIIHSMNIPAARRMAAVCPGSHLLSIRELRRMTEREPLTEILRVYLSRHYNGGQDKGKAPSSPG